MKYTLHYTEMFIEDVRPLTENYAMYYNNCRDCITINIVIGLCFYNYLNTFKPQIHPPTLLNVLGIPLRWRYVYNT